MRTTVLAGLIAAMAMVVGCSSPQDRAAKAQERSYSLDAELKEERLQLLDEYKSCVEGKPANEAETCDYLLKAIEAIQ